MAELAGECRQRVANVRQRAELCGLALIFLSHVPELDPRLGASISGGFRRTSIESAANICVPVP